MRLSRWIRFVGDCVILFAGMYSFLMVMQSLVIWGMPTFSMADWDHGARGLFTCFWGLGVFMFAFTPLGIILYMDEGRA